MKRPPRLRPGDRVALVAPAGPVNAERLQTGIHRSESLGLEPVLGLAVQDRDGYLAGSDAARAADLQAAVDDPSVAAIWALRGGYGTMRLLRRLDLTPLARTPKAFIGFSDNTSLHLALLRLGVVSFHGPHAGYAHFPQLARECFHRVLFEAGAGMLPPSSRDRPVETLRPGTAVGPLTGGNLALLAAACGTPWQMEGRGRIVFLEDVDEPVYRIDRMLVQLVLSGSLAGAAGLAIGRFSRMRKLRTERPLIRVLLEIAADLGIPAVWNLSIGHVADNWTLPLGVPARLNATAGTLELLEPAVA